MFIEPAAICTYYGTTIILVLALAFLVYKYSTRNYDYWKKRNIPYLRPLPFIGNFKDVVTFQRSLTDWHRDIYEATDEPYVGIFFFNDPYLMIRSPDLLKNIMIRDFDHFRDKSVYSPEHDVVQANLIFWQPNRLGWKTVRSKISPFFTSGRLKSMFPLVEKVGKDLQKFIHEKHVNNIVDGKDLCTKYTTDVISKCAFGINANSFKYEDAEIRAVGKRMFDFTVRNVVSQTSYFYFQPRAKLFRMSFYGVRNMKFMIEVLKSVIEGREKSGCRSSDLIDLLVQLKKEKLKEFEGEKIYSPPINLFIGGFETTATTISCLLYELCLNSEIQNKLRHEILTTIERDGITYESVHSMKYLDQCIREILRKYPPVPFADRLCLKDYKIPGTDFVIEKGTPIYVPMMGFHYDEKYFPEPEKFIPERFDNMTEINKNGMYYFPFGEGPRACVGERFGMMSVKLGIVHFISEFEVIKTEKTPDKMKFEKKSLVLQAANGVPISFRPLIK